MTFESMTTGPLELSAVMMVGVGVGSSLGP